MANRADPVLRKSSLPRCIFSLAMNQRPKLTNLNVNEYFIEIIMFEQDF